MKKKLIMIISFLILLTGCNEEKFTPKTKEYYLKNIEIAEKRLVECKKIGATIKDIRIDCINAKLAIDEKISKSNRPIFRDERKVTDW